jgi:hypothetical protein
MRTVDEVAEARLEALPTIRRQFWVELHMEEQDWYWRVRSEYLDPTNEGARVLRTECSGSASSRDLALIDGRQALERARYGQGWVREDNYEPMF